MGNKAEVRLVEGGDLDVLRRTRFRNGASIFGRTGQYTFRSWKVMQYSAVLHRTVQVRGCRSLYVEMAV